MDNFVFQNPVKVIFGKGQIAALASEIPASERVLLLYGMGSIKKNGVYDQVRTALGSRSVVEYPGVEPNPEYATLMGAVELCRRENISFILAVGGGSVVDGAKFIAAAVPFDGDALTILQGKADGIKTALPIGAVLTLPATGSEMNSFSVVSIKAINEKLAFGHPSVFPRFSILDPQVTMSLPPRQMSNGIVDAFVHTTEQYLTYPVNAAIQDRFAESTLKTLIEVGPKVLQDPTNYDHRANMMWAATVALCGIIGVGVPQDWATHMIGHELTALYGIDHAQTLALVLPKLLRVMKEEKQQKLAQFGRNVWGLSGPSDSHIAKDAIQATEDFFNAVGVSTHFHTYSSNRDLLLQIPDRLAKKGMLPLGEKRNIDAAAIGRILEQF
jgi:NADP-dependent alcohol dehydrogenase